MEEKEPRKHPCYLTLKEFAKDLLRNCDTPAKAQSLGKELSKVFSVALTDVALEKWYGDN